MLLKAILSRKLLSPDVYDCVDAVFKLLIRSQSASVRSAAGQLLLIFLVEYPLGPKRLRQHIDFLISNFEYELESGREAALGMVNAIVLKFPAKVLLEHAEYLFVAVVARLVSDRSTSCRAKAASLLTALLRRALADDKSLYDKLVQHGFVWYKDAKAGLTRAAAQLVGLVAEVEGEQFERHFGRALPAFVTCLESEAEAAEAGPVVEAAEAAEGWQNAYHTLRTVERVMGPLSHKLEGADCQPVTTLPFMYRKVVAMCLCSSVTPISVGHGGPDPHRAVTKHASAAMGRHRPVAAAPTHVGRDCGQPAAWSGVRALCPAGIDPYARVLMLLLRQGWFQARTFS